MTRGKHVCSYWSCVKCTDTNHTHSLKNSSGMLLKNQEFNICAPPNPVFLAATINASKAKRKSPVTIFVTQCHNVNATQCAHKSTALTKLGNRRVLRTRVCSFLWPRSMICDLLGLTARNPVDRIIYKGLFWFHIFPQAKERGTRQAKNIDSISFKVGCLFVETISCLPLCTNKSQLITLNITMFCDIMVHQWALVLMEWSTFHSNLRFNISFRARVFVYRKKQLSLIRK